MSLAVLSRFHTQSDAQVAASALRSAGLSPVVFDEHYGGIDWVAQSALGGDRVMLPMDEMADGRAILAVAAEAGPDPEAEAPVVGSLPATAVTLAGGLLTGGEGGWLVTGIRRRQWLDPTAWFAGVVLAATLFLILGLTWAVVWNLLINPP